MIFLVRHSEVHNNFSFKPLCYNMERNNKNCNSFRSFFCMGSSFCAMWTNLHVDINKGDVQICQDICPDQHFYTRYSIEPIMVSNQSRKYAIWICLILNLNFKPDFNTGLVHENETSSLLQSKTISKAEDKVISRVSYPFSSYQFPSTLSDILNDDLDCMNLYIDLQETWKTLANNKNFTLLGMKDNTHLQQDIL